MPTGGLGGQEGGGPGEFVVATILFDAIIVGVVVEEWLRIFQSVGSATPISSIIFVSRRGNWDLEASTICWGERNHGGFWDQHGRLRTPFHGASRLLFCLSPFTLFWFVRIVGTKIGPDNVAIPKIVFTLGWESEKKFSGRNSQPRHAISGSELRITGGSAEFTQEWAIHVIVFAMACMISKPLHIVKTENTFVFNFQIPLKLSCFWIKRNYEKIFIGSDK